MELSNSYIEPPVSDFKPLIKIHEELFCDSVEEEAGGSSENKSPIAEVCIEEETSQIVKNEIENILFEE